MKSQKFSVKIKTTSKMVGIEMERMVMADGGFGIADAKTRPDLLIFEIGDDLNKEFKLLESLSISNAVGEVFVTSREQDTDLLLRAMRAGTKEFISQPLNELEIQSALSGFKKRQKQSAISKPLHNGQIFHVIGAKGGVGTTTVAVNLAMILAEMKKAGSVALVDLNTVFGEIPLFLSVKPTFHWGHITKNLARLDTEFLLNTMAKHKSGVHILPSPSYLNGHPPATAETMERLLEAMKHTFDYIIVDGGQSLDGASIKAMEMSETILLVTLLSLPCLNNTQNLLKSLSNVGAVDKEKLRLIINRYLKKSDISIEDAEKSVRQEIFWNIPNDYKTTMSAINRGIALHNISSKARITKNLMALADSLVEVSTISTNKKGWRLFGRN